MAEIDETHWKRLLQWTAETIGTPPDFFKQLFEENDWGFVIKIHALLEGALNHAITMKLKEPRIADIIAYADTGDKRKGKVAFLKALDITTSEERTFIVTMSQIRNEIAHQVRFAGFTFEEWLKDKNNRQKFIAAFKSEAWETIPFKDGKFPISEFCIAQPRTAILGAALDLVQKAYEIERIARREHAQAQFGRKLVEEEVAKFMAEH